MKQMYQGTLRVRLLYSVIIVLTTCLLIVGGAYRLKAREAHQLREAWERAATNVSPDAARSKTWEVTVPAEVWEQKQRYIRDLEARLQTYEYTYPLKTKQLHLPTSRVN